LESGKDGRDARRSIVLLVHLALTTRGPNLV
jgi:hypothetical protein